jgi:hypothetical protein
LLLEIYLKKGGNNIMMNAKLKIGIIALVVGGIWGLASIFPTLSEGIFVALSSGSLLSPTCLILMPTCLCLHLEFIDACWILSPVIGILIIAGIGYLINKFRK